MDAITCQSVTTGTTSEYVFYMIDVTSAIITTLVAGPWWEPTITSNLNRLLGLWMFQKVK